MSHFHGKFVKDLNETFYFKMSGDQQLIMSDLDQELLTTYLQACGATITGGHEHSIAIEGEYFEDIILDYDSVEQLIEQL